MVCFRYIILNTLHKGDNKDEDDDDDDNNNNNNNNNNNIIIIIMYFRYNYVGCIPLMLKKQWQIIN